MGRPAIMKVPEFTSSAVYSIHNKRTDFHYVGSTINVKRRVIANLSQLRHNQHKNDRLQEAFHRDRESSFEWLILEKCARTELIQKETEWIAKLKHYNLRDPANKTMHPETIEKIRKSCIGVNTWMKGRTLSKETVAKVIASRKRNNKPLSEESRRRYALSKLGEKNPAFRHSDKVMKEVQRLRKIGWTYQALSDKFGMCPGHARNLCLGKRTYKPREIQWT